MVRPEDFGGVTDPLAAFANTSTMPGPGAGKAIDPSRPSIDPTKPGPDADRIADWLCLPWRAVPAYLTEDQAEIRTRDGWLLCCLPGDGYADYIVRKCNASSPAPSHGPQDVREALKIIVAALEQAQDCILGETPEDMSHEEAREDTCNKIREAMFDSIPAVRAALAQSDAQPKQQERGTLSDIICRSYYEHEPLTDYRTVWQHIADNILAEYPAIAPTTPPSLPEGAREALEKIERGITAVRLETALNEQPIAPDVLEQIHKDLLAIMSATPTPSSAGLIEAAEWHEEQAAKFAASDYHTDKMRGLMHKEDACKLRARAADRSAT